MWRVCAGDNFNRYVANTSFYLNESIIPMIHALRNSSLIPFTYPTLPFVCGQVLSQSARTAQRPPSASLLIDCTRLCASQLLPQWVLNVSHPERAGVRDALALLPQYVPYSGHAPSQGLEGDLMWRSGWDNSVIHFTGKSHRIFGQRYHAAYNAALLNSPEQPSTQRPAGDEEGRGVAQLLSSSNSLRQLLPQLFPRAPPSGSD
jgi:hypothetical protein